MPLDDRLQARMAEPDFWPLYLFDEYLDDEELDDEEEGYTTQFGIGEGPALLLTVDLDGYHEVGLVVPGKEETTLGWDDEAHFHPHVMRWSELDLLCRAVALHDPSLRHPGPMLALLARFAFLDDEDGDPDKVGPLLDAAFRLVRSAPGKGTCPETRAWYEARDLRGAGIRWTTRPDGHQAVDQREDPDLELAELYTLRTSESEDFPFADWAALQDRARETVTIADPALQNPVVRSALEQCTRENGDAHLHPLAKALRGAGFTNPVLLRALEDPTSPTESCWAVETLAGLDQGRLVKSWFGPSPLA